MIDSASIGVMSVSRSPSNDSDFVSSAATLSGGVGAG